MTGIPSPVGHLRDTRRNKKKSTHHRFLRVPPSQQYRTEGGPGPVLAQHSGLHAPDYIGDKIFLLFFIRTLIVL